MQIALAWAQPTTLASRWGDPSPPVEGEISKARISAVIGAAAVVSLGGLLAAAPAQAAAHYSLHTYSAYDFADSTAHIQHKLQSPAGWQYGNWAGPGEWSYEPNCPVTVYSYTVNIRTP
ncbi:hypothetical protein ACIRCZ_18800 [Leifsonia sp. NPDC102414]|uniref:hypothetical protein n=1 Tax=Leifsonia sp. NPDC102414 TaxID=3364124 RepID=UPI0037F4AD87